MKLKLKIGDKVLLKESSKYVYENSFDGDSSNPLNIFGIIDDVTGWYSVKWENGKHNGAYTDDDLELVNELIHNVGSIILVDDMIDDCESVCEILECDENNEDGENYLVNVLYGNFSLNVDWIDKKQVFKVLSIKDVEEYLMDRDIKYKIGDVVNGQKVIGFDTQEYYYILENNQYTKKDIFESQKEEISISNILEENTLLEEENKVLKALVKKLEEENLGLKAELALFLIEIEQEKEEKPKKRRILFG